MGDVQIRRFALERVSRYRLGLGELTFAPDAGGDADAGDAVAPETGAGRCTSSRGPAMVEIPSKDGGALVCIDSTAVSKKAHYLEFLESVERDAAAMPDLRDVRDAGCPASLSLLPTMGWPPTLEEPLQHAVGEG